MEKIKIIRMAMKNQENKILGDCKSYATALSWRHGLKNS